jgi:hypothetical protein
VADVVNWISRCRLASNQDQSVGVVALESLGAG